MFEIDRNTGKITTRVPLKDLSGTYNLTVEARDKGQPQALTGRARVVIVVGGANKGPPVWVIPATENENKTVPEVSMRTNIGG